MFNLKLLLFEITRLIVALRFVGARSLKIIMQYNRLQLTKSAKTSYITIDYSQQILSVLLLFIQYFCVLFISFHSYNNFQYKKN